MSIPEKVLSLVEVFERNADAYQAAPFKEAELRQQFVNPLFKCLGWDMDNEQGYAEAYKDVVHDRLVYDLYGLTEEEVRIVEGAAS